MSFLDSIFGSKKKDPVLSRTSTTTPGFNLSSSFGDGGVGTSLSRTGSMPQLEFERRFPASLGEIDVLKSKVAPTASLFRTAAFGQLSASEQETVGNLRQQLSRRGLAGASFAADTEGRVRAEFGLKRANLEASTAAQELALTQQLIEFESNLMTGALQRELAELGVASGVTMNMGQIVSANANAANALAAAESAARMQFIGQMAGTATAYAAFGGGKSSVFAPKGGGPAPSSGTTPFDFG